MKGLIFTGDSVRAILAGRKTQTRRLGDKPRYAVGEVVYLKEAHAYCPTTYKPGGIIYRADGDDDHVLPGEWRSSLHLREADARLFVRIDAVRREWLQEISDADVEAEGVMGDSYLAELNVSTKDSRSAKIYFMEIWDRINGRRAPWASNPEVFVYQFTPVERPV